MSQDSLLMDVEALVRCESPSDDLGACSEVIGLANEIAKRVLGNPARILTIKGRPVFWWGDENPKVVLLGHLDTVWPKGSFEPLWDVTGDIARGPGIFDMKAGFVQALYALQGIEGSVALIATTDEETGSATSREMIEDVSRKSEAVLVLEASLDGKVKIGRKGTAMYQITVHGKAAHAGLEPEKGINATTEIAAIVLQMAALENSVEGTTVVPTVLRSGNTTNTVPELATLDIDIRSYSQAELIRVDQAIRGLKTKNESAYIEISGGLNRPPLETTSTKSLYEQAAKVARDMGFELGAASVGGASDGNFAAAVGAKVLDGLGAVGSGAHAQSEWASVKELSARSAFLHQFIRVLLHE